MKTGDFLTIKTQSGTALHVRVIRPNADAIDHRRCTRCGETFGYGPIGEMFPGRKLVCAFDCMK